VFQDLLQPILEHGVNPTQVILILSSPKYWHYVMVSLAKQRGYPDVVMETDCVERHGMLEYSGASSTRIGELVGSFHFF
jgi:hypothetical protein